MNIAAFIVLFVVIDCVIVTAVFWGAVEFGWNSLARKHPAVQPQPDAVCRNFQSFRLNWMNFGWCVHVAADEEYLHMRPARLLRIFGAQTISIPWKSIVIHKQSRSGNSMTVKIDEKDAINGPGWCLGLADPSTTD